MSLIIPTFAEVSDFSNDKKALAHGFTAKLPQAEGQQQPVKSRQNNQNGRQRKVRELWHERSSQAFAGVDQRIDQHSFLQDGKFVQRAPRVVSSAKENQRSQNHTEHQSNMLLIDAATQCESTAR